MTGHNFGSQADYVWVGFLWSNCNKQYDVLSEEVSIVLSGSYRMHSHSHRHVASLLKSMHYLSEKKKGRKSVGVERELCQAVCQLSQILNIWRLGSVFIRTDSTSGSSKCGSRGWRWSYKVFCVQQKRKLMQIRQGQFEQGWVIGSTRWPIQSGFLLGWPSFQPVVFLKYSPS